MCRPGFDPSLLGKNLTDSKDLDGKFFIKERIEVAKAKGSGWQDYKFTDPLTKNKELKTLYFEKYGDISWAAGHTSPGNEDIIQRNRYLIGSMTAGGEMKSRTGVNAVVLCLFVAV